MEYYNTNKDNFQILYDVERSLKMEREELFKKIDSVMNEAFENMEKSEDLKQVYNKIRKNFNEDADLLRKMLKEELDRCYKTIENKKIITDKVEDKSIISDSDQEKHDIFVIIPIFNATDEQAEECIYSVMDNFLGFDYKILIISNRILHIFNEEIFKNTSHYVVYKNLFSLPEA